MSKNQNQKFNLVLLIPILSVVFFIVSVGVFVGFNYFGNEEELTIEVRDPSSFENSSSSEIELVDEGTKVDFAGEQLTALMQKAGADLGFLSSQNIIDLGFEFPLQIEERFIEVLQGQYPKRTPLSDIIQAPENPEITSTLVWDQYGITAPITYGEFTDIYAKKTDGTIDFNNLIDNNPVDSPIQTKLKNGIVHLPFSPLPGEEGNSYIVGHSSNFSSVQSDYNEIFKPIERTSKSGDEFIIYDHKGRELQFRVFDSFAVDQFDNVSAYRTYGNRRIVTLQSSILETVNGRLEPTKRWLTLAELVEN